VDVVRRDHVAGTLAPSEPPLVLATERRIDLSRYLGLRSNPGPTGEGSPMQAPPEHPSTHERDLIVLPEARLPMPSWVPLVVVGVAALALVVGAVAMDLSERGDLRDRDAAIAAATRRVMTAEADARAAAARIRILESRVTGLRTVLDRSRARTVVVGANRAELRRQLGDAQRELDRARARITALSGTSMPGPPVWKGLVGGML
jgi:hypothetical protein